MNLPKLTIKKAVSAIIIILAIVLVLLAIGIKVASQNRPVISNNTLTYVIIGEKSSQTVFDALKELSNGGKAFELKYNNNYSFGVFVESIGGIKNGDGGKYWQYYVNGKLGEVAADKKEVKAGDKVEWRFEKADF